jgi:hypothetical protein
MLLWCQAYAALPPGGAFIALDVIIDDVRRSNVWGMTMSLNMLLEFGKENAGDYTFQVRAGTYAKAPALAIPACAPCMKCHKCMCHICV